MFFVAAGVFFFAGSAPAAQTTASLESQYQKAATEWRALLSDEKRGGFRDPWLDLEKRFLAIAARDLKGDTGAKSRYQAARCRQELAGRSFLTSDWRQAANLFLDLGKKHPRHSLADDGLYEAAVIAAARLNKADEARSILKTLIDTYPKGDMAPRAKKMLASLSGSGSSETAARTEKTASGNEQQGKTERGNAPAKPDSASAGSAKPMQATPQKSQQTTSVTRVLCRGTSKHTTVVLELDGTASYRYQYLAPTAKRGARLVVDVEDARLAGNIKPAIAVAGMVVSEIRSSARDAKGKRGARIIIDVGNMRHYTVDSGVNPPGVHVQCSVSRDLAGGRTPPEGGKNGPVLQGRHVGSGALQAGTLMEQLGLTVKTVMIDAGHGGKDPGAMANGVTEKQITLTLAKMLGAQLEKQGFTVLYTRTKDDFVALDQRAVIANNKKADLFISLHVNASKDKNTNGLETYFLDLARTNSAATVAARENAVSVKSISDLQFILTDLMLTSKLRESQDLAATVHQKMFNRLKQAGFTMGDNGVRSAPFYVLMGARMPAVLVEIGYCSHAADSRRIKSLKYLERLAEGIAQGVVAYKGKLARFAGK